MNPTRLCWRAVAALAALTLAACEGPPGPTGPTGPSGEQGEPGESGVIDAGNGAQPGFAAREGLSLAFDHVQVANDGTVTAFFSLTDANGLALDRNGVRSVGAVSSSFILAKLNDPNGALGPGEYTALTTRTATTPDGGNPQTQAATDSGGTYNELAPGKYAYVLKTKIPAPVAASDIFAIGAYATRVYNGLTYVSNAVYPFNGTGAASTAQRDIVATATCDKCHGILKAHGGGRREVKLCVLCHNAGTVDPDTNNTVDLPVMGHKIHMGENLPSVLDGGTYEIIGFRQSVADYSKVALPPPNAPNNCPFCHVPGATAQADIWNREPTMKVCGSCHDRTWFGNPTAVPAGWTGHTAGEQANDSACPICHTPTSITNVHIVGDLAPNQPQSLFTIQNVTRATPGQSPVVTFKVTLDGGTVDILATPITRIAVTYAGPTTPYTNGINYYLNRIIQSRTADGGYTSDGTITATGTPGVFTVDLATPDGGSVIPANADGTWYFALEGYLRSAEPRYATDNRIVPVAVTGSTATPKRNAVDTNKCNQCHFKLGAHGGARVNAQYCDLCHNPLNLNDERISHFEGQDITVHTVDAKVFLHKLHMGERLTQKPYIIGTFPTPSRTNPAGAPVDFSEVLFPNDQRNCQACHVSGGNTLPFGEGRSPTEEAVYTCLEDPGADPDNYCEPAYFAPKTTSFIPPESATCTSCHDSSFAVAHAATMTSAGMEACATCHGPGTAYDVVVVHAPLP